jgi:glycine betaine/proline transport system permease protein
MVAGAGAFIVLTAIITFIWGSGMEFPVDVGRDLASWVNDRIDEITRNGAFIFDTVSDVVLKFLIWLEDLLLWLPWPSAIAGVGFVAWRTIGLRVAVFAVFALLSTGAVGLWPSAMETAALIIVSVIISITIAVPIGILAARSDTVDSITRPILDGMQTMPPFVYLVPAIMFFGIGNVPAIFATVIYAVPPAIRLTNLGIRQVSSDVVEAARSFGTTPSQLLVKVQIPMAVPTIMAGINQTTMMALGMVVVASLVGAGGLGEDVLRALSRFQPGEALLAGLAIVGLAIITDRLTQAAAKGRQAALHGPGR